MKVQFTNDNNLFKRQMEKKILVLDGAMGTMIQQANLTAADFGGEQYDGCNEILNLTQPALIQEIHEEYLKAGADIIETNTFGASSIVLAEYELEDRVEEINMAAVHAAKRAIDKYGTSDWPRFIAGSIGPTTKALSVTGGISFEALVKAYYQQAVALIQGGVDLLLIETAQDTLNVKAAGIGIQKAFTQLEIKLPIMISGTIETMGTTLAGQNIESFYISLEHFNPVSIGINCATGPEFMRDHLRTLSNLSGTAISCYPNAGLPDEDGHYHESPEEFANQVADFAEYGWLNIAGGCCGTTPEHIKKLSEKLNHFKPRLTKKDNLSAVSGIEPLFLEDDNRPILVGERSNVIGSKKFRDLISNNQYEEASEIARSQVKGGAQVIDICLANPDRDELNDMEQFLQYAVKKVKVPLMIDSTDTNVIIASLKYSQGKAIINSINLENGEKRFEEILPYIHQYGAAIVVGTIDEEGMAVSRDRKLAIARRSYDLLVNKYDIPPEDIIFDPLVFPIGTGDKNYIGSAVETIEGIRLIKEAFPKCKTILGISNVSFGLPPAGREVVNAIFLYHTTIAGLDYAIVNTQKLQRYASIKTEEREMSEKLIFQTDEQYLADFIAFYRDKKVKVKKKTVSLNLEERLSNYVIEGTKEGLLDDLQAALQKYSPLKIINGPLMDGMKEVGKLFNNNELIVAEVLQSAEVMKASVAFLEPHMERQELAQKGKILLATVKGDVHDIGKNLVDIILSNNGYQVINLGIKVPPEQLIEAYKKEKPNAIGLSGLLVKSAQQMVSTAQDLKASGIDIPLIVGGAALTRRFTENRIAMEYGGPVLYAKDAMNGLSIVNQLNDKSYLQAIKKRAETDYLTDIESVGQIENESAAKQLFAIHTNKKIKKSSVYTPPDFKRHVLKDYSIEQLQPYVNMRMLLGKHLGIKGNVEQLIAIGDKKTLDLKEKVDQLFLEANQERTIRAHGIYQFFPAQADGNDIIIYDPKNLKRVIKRFSFPRQQVEPYLCLSDFLRPVEEDVMDYVGFLIVSTGENIREQASRLREKGEYLRSHMLQATALELAEAFAERVHQRMRELWGFPDPIDMSMEKRFSAKYQGIRVSFGYPACPNLEDQVNLFELLHPEDIGIQLTEGFMMEPEASVSAMVFSHSAGRYFQV